MKLWVPKQPNTLRRYQAVKDRFEHLFNVKRIRYDDVIKQLSQEYFFSEESILRILKTDLPDQVLPDGRRVKQGELFESSNDAKTL